MKAALEPAGLQLNLSSNTKERGGLVGIISLKFLKEHSCEKSLDQKTPGDKIVYTLVTPLTEICQQGK